MEYRTTKRSEYRELQKHLSKTRDLIISHARSIQDSEESIQWVKEQLVTLFEKEAEISEKLDGFK